MEKTLTSKQLDNLAKALSRYEVTESYILKYHGLEVLEQVKQRTEIRKNSLIPPEDVKNFKIISMKGKK